MGIQISKSFKVAPGVRVRLGNKSSSLSVGGKGGRVTLNSSGRRTTTVRIPPGVSYTTSSGGVRQRRSPSRAAAKPSIPAVADATAPLGPQIAPRRRILGGWVAADLRAIVIHRTGQDDLRIPLAQLAKVDLEGKRLIISASSYGRMELQLTTFMSSRDLHFVEIVARAAGLTASPGA
ncbi:DUF4236 domain-containing protein [Streptomyces sp. NPDC088354]|uniref:DUF4236 domain-containing protein n=1 Tax=Streptomyces sp. NPDC088354 TaxID=3365856 RepID=UPI003821FA56